MLYVSYFPNTDVSKGRAKSNTTWHCQNEIKYKFRLLHGLKFHILNSEFFSFFQTGFLYQQGYRTYSALLFTHS